MNRQRSSETKVGNRLDASAPVRPDLMDDGMPIYRHIPPLQPDRIDIVYLHDPQPESAHLGSTIDVYFYRRAPRAVVDRDDVPA
jgi:hypothetical protein